MSIADNQSTIPAMSQEVQPSPDQIPGAQLDNLVDEHEILVGEYRLLLTPEQMALVGDERGKLAETMTGETDHVARTLGKLEVLLLDSDEKTKWPPVIGASRVITELEDSLGQVLEAKLEKYKDTPKGKEDLRTALLRQATKDPESLPPTKLAEAAQSLHVKLGGARARISAKHRHGQLGDLRAAARARLHQPGTVSDKSTEAEATLISIVSRAFGFYDQDHLELTQQAKIDRPRQPWTLRSLDEYLDRTEAMQDRAGQRLFKQWTEDDLRPVLSAVVRGDMPKEKVLATLKDAAKRSTDIDNLVARALEHSEREMKRLYGEPSLVGLTFGEDEIKLIESYVETTNEFRRAVGHRQLTEDWVTEIVRYVRHEQDELREFIDDSNTLYWTFTPNARKIFKTGQLKSAAHADVIQHTGTHSKGIHFIKPGDFTEDFTTTYVDYAASTRSSSAFVHTTESGVTVNGVHHIEGALGIAVVYPLDALIKTTPLRNERKTIDHTASNSTFRPQDGSNLYSYSLDEAFIVPAWGSEQVPRDVVSEVDPETGKNIWRPFSEPIRLALKESGYSDEWIEAHLIETPYDMDPRVRMQAAEAEITRRLQAQGAKQSVVVPLRASRGWLEGLDSHGRTSKGGHSEPYIENLITVQVA